MISHFMKSTIVICGLSASLHAGQCKSEENPPCDDWCRAYLGVQAEAVEDSRVVKIDATGARSKIVDYYYAVDEDCSSSRLVKLEILQQPLTGALSQDDALERVQFPVGNARSVCNSRKAHAVRLFYERGPAFSGNDTFVVRVDYPNGAATTVTYEIAAKR